MLKKSIVFFVTLLVVNGAYAADAYAAPSVKKLGTVGVSSSAVKSLPVVPRTQNVSPSADSLQTKAAVAPVSKTVTADSTNRLSGVSSIKTVSSGKVTPVVSGTSGGAELQVVESGSGNYVSDVASAGGNKLNVTKTRLLYAPVRRGNSDNIVGDAEIWVVR